MVNKHFLYYACHMSLFLIVMMAVGRVLPGPESYIDGSLATMFCRFLYSDVNCETLYDTLFYIDMFVILSLAVLIYLAFLNLINRYRKR